ncbi:MAG: FAD-binding and (Fe-S)-binding domain-containing protein [Desulfohalobiaceae bacterium]
MIQKHPHISIPNQDLVHRVLGLSTEEFASWPESEQELAAALAAELFLVRYNPFIPAQEVYRSVCSRLNAERVGLSQEIYVRLQQGLQAYWQEFLADQEFKDRLLARLQDILPQEYIVKQAHALVECATDATDLRLEVPLLMVSPASTQEVQQIVALALELGFCIVPRGGGSGLTGGSIPARRRCVILSLSRMKSIQSIDPEQLLLCAQSGVITLDAIRAAEKQGLLFTVDPASKAASSLGGNISENAGGPFAFEYGTTLDNLLSYKMVLPSAEVIEVQRREHPRHKIHPWETVRFDVFDQEGSRLRSVNLSGEQIRSPGLGKDVANKYLGGLPGIQKEGVDGVITEACFTLQPMLMHSQTLCLEFFGNSMHNAMLVIKDLVYLRDEIRRTGDRVKMSALEEFGSKYVQAIDYEKKSSKYEGEPISVLLMQLDSDYLEELEGIRRRIVDIAEGYHNVDVFVAQDKAEAEKFWQDRHRLSAITKRTSGFKINEDVVIPIDVIPEFSDFIESLNLYYLALGYRKALQEVSSLQGVDPGDEFIDMEINFSSRVISGRIDPRKLPEQEFELQIRYFFRDLRSRYPDLAEQLKKIEEHLFATRIMVANHMHAGDGNCHVNIPVNSNDAQMLRLAEEAAGKVFTKVLELQGSVTGEHGIGITKIGYLEQEKIQALQDYKTRVDPQNIFNPGKLSKGGLDYPPFTFSFNRLLQDIDQTSLPGKEKLTSLLKNIQICSRCGKCKQVCPMYYPEQGFLYHPRNKIITLGALIEAIYYTQQDQGRTSKDLLAELRNILDRCTACGKCTSVCPVKIDMPEQILNMRSFLQESPAQSAKGLKQHILRYLTRNPGRIPSAAKLAWAGQSLQRATWAKLPASWRNRFSTPLLRTKMPDLGFRNLDQILHLGQKNVFFPEQPANTAVFYFPGCGAGLFYPEIGQAALYLLLKLGFTVLMPPRHLCCGYPLLAAGCSQEYQENQDFNLQHLRGIKEQAEQLGLRISHVLTSCGTCREAIAKHEPRLYLDPGLRHMDVLQLVLQQGPELRSKLLQQPPGVDPILYHPACHSEWSGVRPDKSGEIYARELGSALGSEIRISPGCCAESGLGAMTSPQIYNVLRQRKHQQLQKDLQHISQQSPVLVGCPSCKIGISRILLESSPQTQVLHSLEYLAALTGGKNWRKKLQKMLNIEADQGQKPYAHSEH